MLGSACTGADGDPCQENDDCNSGLMCCKPTSSLSARGICEASCSERPRPDSGPAGMDGGSDDAGPAADAGSDAAADPDSGPADAGPTDGGPDGGPDSGPADGGPDTGV